MKQSILQTLFLVLTIIFFSSCSEVKDFSSNPSSIDALDKRGNDTHTQSAKAEINGESGGSLSMEKKYTNPYGESATVKSTLIVPAGAFTGTKNISMTTDDSDLSIKFSPKLTFNIPVLPLIV